MGLRTLWSLSAICAQCTTSCQALLELAAICAQCRNCTKLLPAIAAKHIIHPKVAIWASVPMVRDTSFGNNHPIYAAEPYFPHRSNDPVGCAGDEAWVVGQ